MVLSDQHNHPRKSPQQVWALWRQESLAPAGNRTTIHQFPSHQPSLYTINAVKKDENTERGQSLFQTGKHDAAVTSATSVKRQHGDVTMITAISISDLCVVIISGHPMHSTFAFIVLQCSIVSTELRRHLKNMHITCKDKAFVFLWYHYVALMLKDENGNVCSFSPPSNVMLER
jgi:hypothetical protein